MHMIEKLQFQIRNAYDLIKLLQERMVLMDERTSMSFKAISILEKEIMEQE